MRRLEYIGGGSEKFWEGTREGTGVVLSWGRIGTAGQTKVKEFADVDAAEAFLAKQVAEKVKKGYTDAGAPASVTPPAAEPASVEPEVSAWPDEDTFAPAPGVVRMAYPRRDQGRPKHRPDPEAVAVVAGLVARHRDHLDAALDNRASEGAIVDAVRRHEAGSPDPLGAAAIATMVNIVARWGENDELGRLGHAWLAEHGLLFAVEATMALSTISVHNNVNELRYAAEDEDPRWRWPGPHVLGEVRAAVAAADDAEYAKVVDLLAELRTDRKRRLVASFLAPTETAWLDDLRFDDQYYGDHLLWLCLAVARTPEQLADIDGQYQLHRHGRVLPTIVRTVGPGAAPTLLRWAERAETDVLRRVLAAVVEMPTDEAFRGLLERVLKPNHRPAVQAAMRRYPVRATRILSTALVDEPEDTEWLPAAKELLRAHLIALPALLDEIVPTLPPAARAAAEATQEGVVRLPEAPADLLPPVLASPPWTRKRKPVERVVLPDLVVPAPTRIVWAQGEKQRAEVAGARFQWAPYEKENVDWAAEYQKARHSRWQVSTLLLYAPVDLAVPWLAEWRGEEAYGIQDWGPALFARFDVAAADMVIECVASDPAHEVLKALLPVLDTRVAALVAHAFSRLKSARPSARAWLLRHGVAALPYLLPAVLGKAGKERDDADQALRVIAGQVGADAVLAESERLAGAQAGAGVAAVLATDPLELLPKKLPVPGAWAEPAALPQLRLRDKDFALSAASTMDVLTMLALGKPGEPYGGVSQVAQECDPGSFAEFGWQVFEQWRRAGMPPKDGWALTALGAVGDDETVRRLTPVIRAWPGEGGHARAVTGLDVLAEIGTDVALMHLNGIAQKVKFGGLKQRARERIELVAANLGLTAAQLADRLVPDLGLAEDGTMVLDYGPRRFVVGFDEQLRPFVSDEDGTRRKALPKPGAKDDTDRATEAYQRFTALKKDVRTLAGDQITRLERAMVTGRRWTPEDFTAYFAGHPLLWHVVRRLVWGVYDESGAVVGSFRLAEDRTLADVDDEVYVVPEGATVGVAHPLHLGDALAAWSEVFADYEILQPFSQLGRQVLALTDEERAASRLVRFEQVKVPIGKVLGLTKRGWERTMPQDGGVEAGIVKPLPDGRFAVLHLEDGIVAGDPGLLGDEQTIDSVFLSHDHDGFWYLKEETMLMSTMDNVSASELLVDLTELVSGATK